MSLLLDSRAEGKRKIMDYDKLEAGREANARIAECVMGWERLDSKIGSDRFRLPNGQLKNTFIQAESFAGLICFMPSQRISDAWLVVEKLRERFQYVSLVAANGYGLTCWDIGDEAEAINIVGPFNADTAALAICKTALSAALKATDSTRP